MNSKCSDQPAFDSVSGQRKHWSAFVVAQDDLAFTVRIFITKFDCLADGLVRDVAYTNRYCDFELPTELLYSATIIPSGNLIEFETPVRTCSLL